MQSAAWKHLWTPTGLEVVTLDGSTAEGDILWLDDAARPHRLRYRVEWDARGHTRVLDCASVGPDGRHACSLTASGNGQWWTRDGEDLPELAACMDVDLWPTPFTNTLPLRRLRLPEGQSVEVTVAYVEAPELRVRAKAQRYTALGDRRYRFESLDDDFSAEILLAGDDLVQRYEGLFERIA